VKACAQAAAGMQNDICVAWGTAEIVMFCCVQICGSQKLLDQFVESNKLLDSVQKGLADYLETKRLAFAR
jgi:hypothetical protein